MSNTPPSRELLRSLSPLKVLSLTKTDDGWAVEAEGNKSSVCPNCQTVSRSRHSRYRRCLQDLPLQGAPVALRLRLSRWRCREPSCGCKVFVERLPSLCLPHSQRTVRSGQIVAVLGHALGGRPAQRLAGRLGVLVSRDTLLRQVKQAAVQAPPAGRVRVLGVDDWAWRKGQSYGTILVDLERRCVIDVLPDRSADSFANWLTTRPEVKVVSRDRQGLYADGSRRGAPQAVQVADRFHLLQNLIEAVEKQLTPMLNAMIIPGAMGPLASGVGVAEQPSAAGAVLPVLERESVPEAQRAVVRAWFEQVMTLHRQGRNNQQIMRATGVGRRRVETWTRLGYLPERNRMAPRVGMPESFRGYLSQRWTQGCRSAKDLLKEVRKQGYVGCYSGLADLLSSWRSSRTVSPPTTAVVSTPVMPISAADNSRRLAPKVAAALLAKHPGELTEQQAQTVATLKANGSQIIQIRHFLLQFRAILRGSTKAKLNQWLNDVERSGLMRLERFAEVLRRDKAAVENAVTMPWSNGQVEGQATS